MPAAGSAPTSVTVQVVANHIPQAQARVREVVAAAVKRAGLDVEARAKQYAPVRTGTLRRSIHTVLSADGMTARVGPSVTYGFFVEFGTRRSGAQPYMRPAAAIVLPRFADEVRLILRRGVV